MTRMIATRNRARKAFLAMTLVHQAMIMAELARNSLIKFKHRKDLSVPLRNYSKTMQRKFKIVFSKVTKITTHMRMTMKILFQ